MELLWFLISIAETSGMYFFLAFHFSSFHWHLLLGCLCSYSWINEFIIVAIPSSISIAAPAIETHFLNKGALLSSQPVTPPSKSIGERAVPKPNKTAKPTLPSGLA